MYSPNVVNKMNELAYRFKPMIHRSIYEVLKQPRYYNTGAGVASLTVDVVEGNESKAPVIQIHFDNHLLILEKRRIMWTKFPDMKALLEWAETKKSDPREVKSLAFGTAYKQKTYDSWKPKLWRKKSLSGVLKEINRLVLAGFDQAIGQDLEEAVKV